MARSFFPEINEELFTKAKNKVDRKGKPQSFISSSSAKLHFVNNTERLKGQNVAGYLEGTDKKNELLVITAHYDHLGKKDTLIYHGADDDGSGTSAVIELAKVFNKAKHDGHGPRRSILFMTVSGEEKGLLGSSYYVEHPLFPLSQTVADLNIDMIGRTDPKHDSLGIRNYIYIIGSDKLSTQLHRINENANMTYTKLDLDYTYNSPGDKHRFYYRSDHYNFAKNNIPVIFYFNGTHADYHRPTDTIDKIDFDLLAKRAQLVFFTAWDLANRDERIKVDVKSDFEEKK
jgi:Zn-dependent M28 family amino/carboxypeptidase